MLNWFECPRLNVVLSFCFDLNNIPRTFATKWIKLAVIYIDCIRLREKKLSIFILMHSIQRFVLRLSLSVEKIISNWYVKHKLVMISSIYNCTQNKCLKYLGSFVEHTSDHKAFTHCFEWTIHSSDLPRCNNLTDPTQLKMVCSIHSKWKE